MRELQKLYLVSQALTKYQLARERRSFIERYREICYKVAVRDNCSTVEFHYCEEAPKLIYEIKNFKCIKSDRAVYSNFGLQFAFMSVISNSYIASYL